MYQLWTFYIANDIQNIDLKIYIHHRSSNEINLNNRNAFTNVTLIASNVEPEMSLFILKSCSYFFLFTILSPVNLETRGDPFEMRFFKISARSNNNFLRPYFSSHLISEFRALSITHTKKTCQNATVLLSRSENFMTMARINFG